jgi:hypothetical protein
VHGPPLDAGNGPVTNTTLRALIETCRQLPTEDAIARVLALRDDFVAKSDPASAAECVRECILLRFRDRDLDRALVLAEQLTNETGRIDDMLLYGLVCERAGLEAKAREVFDVARAKARLERDILVVTCFINQHAAPRPTDATDAGTYASLADAYFDMGLMVDALRTLLIGVRRYPEDWQVVESLLEKLVAGVLTGDRAETS